MQAYFLWFKFNEATSNLLQIIIIFALNIPQKLDKILKISAQMAIFHS